MKKLLSAMLIIVNMNCFAQANKWFVSFSITPVIGGPSASLKKQMVDQHFDQTSEFDFLGLTGTTKYPIVSKDAAILLRGGKQLTERKSIYFVVGQSAGGEVEGFRNEGYSSFLFFGGSYGQKIEIQYNTYQFTAGYLYSFSKTRSKIGFGPSIFLFDYSITQNYDNKEGHTAVSPGVTFTTRVPFGKEKKLVGIELVLEGNAGLPVKMKGSPEGSDFQPGKVNMCSANMGIAISFRR